jgi:small subunit ribosomal protein S14
MAKKSSVNKNNRRRKLVAQYAAKRKRLKAIAADLTKPGEERFAARLKLAQLPRNSAPSRVRNRCELTGRARGYYRKLRLCRNMLRDLASQGMIPGMTKSSW